VVADTSPVPATLDVGPEANEPPPLPAPGVITPVAGTPAALGTDTITCLRGGSALLTGADPTVDAAGTPAVSRDATAADRVPDVCIARGGAPAVGGDIVRLAATGLRTMVNSVPSPTGVLTS
jgi:hypothetical protein